MGLSAEQKARMERNKQEALKKRNKAGSVGKAQKSMLQFFKRAPATKTTSPSSAQKEVLVDKVMEGIEKKEVAKEKEPTPVPTPQGPIVQSHSEAQKQLAFKTPPGPERKRSGTGIETDEDEDGSVAPVSKSPVKKTRKRIRRIVDSDDSSDEYIPEKVEESENDDEDDDYKMEDEDLDGFIVDDDYDSDEPATKKKKPQKKDVKSGLKTKQASKEGPKKVELKSPPPAKPKLGLGMFNRTPSSLTKKTPTTSKPKSTSIPFSGGKPKKETEEQMHKWLRDPKDKNGRRPGEPDYDPTSLYIPPAILSGQQKGLTPFERQYWNIKKDMMTTILFFAKGKFYEMYNQDADVAHTEFNMKVTDRVNMRMCGFPVTQFTLWAEKFIELGYKVALADEQSTALAKQMTGQKGIVDRSLTQIFTPGSLSGDLLIGDMSSFMMAIKEHEKSRRFGIAFVDAAIGEFNLCEFEDDPAFTQLETLLVQIKPKEIVVEKNGLSKATKRLLRLYCAGVEINSLEPNDMQGFWSHEMTMDMLTRFPDLWRGPNGETSTEQWPSAMQDMLKQEDPLAVSSLGGLVSYLMTLKVVINEEDSLLKRGRFLTYNPMQQGQCLMLDGQTLQNLDILQNSTNGTEYGTLFSLICHTRTGFGKRLFRKWVCHPLKDTEKIKARFTAVDDLEANTGGWAQKIHELFAILPDIERLVAQVNTCRCPLPKFMKALDSLDLIWDAIQEIQDYVDTLKSPMLRTILKIGSKFPNLEQDLQFFRDAFDREQAREGTLHPKPGADEEFDACQEQLADIEGRLEEQLKDARKTIDPRAKFYQPHGKDIYQIEIPAKCKVPNGWDIKSSTKNVKRYWTSEVRQLVGELNEAKETHSILLAATLKKMQSIFASKNSQFTQAVECLANVDCLISLMKTKELMGQPMCRPQFVEPEPGQSAVLDVKELRHPCLVESGFVPDFIPNDTRLGGNVPLCTILTGPNMGGKSTLLRQTCVAVIMAQLGCYVPAQEFKLTPVDRIFTRIGANDNIMAGRSTFMVELKETANIIKQATERSLVILDELGRGTSTFDGYAIAHATLSHLLSEKHCRLMFATHYHMLTDAFGQDKNVQLMHMASHVEPGKRDVVFLYKLLPGVCSKSYGLNVASMAGIGDEIVASAEQKSREFEATSKAGKLTAKRRHEAQLKTFMSLCHQIKDVDMSSESVDGLLRLVNAL
eukprot:m.4776 g.4776  ORF g.4776 m.4776 type:complete len:1204 (+) comp3101_c0_seq1:98-3709(+)